MSLVIATDRGWVDVDRYLDEVAERRALFLTAASAYLELSETALAAQLAAGATLGELARTRQKCVDGLKARIGAALQTTEQSLAGLLLGAIVEHLVDFPAPAQRADRDG